MKEIIKKGIEVTAGVAIEKLGDKTRELWDEKIKFPKVLEKTREQLLNSYGEKSFYNDIDKYCSQNNVIENLLDNLSENDNSEKYTQKSFCEHHINCFLDYYPKYLKDILCQNEIKSFFNDMYSSVYEKVVLLPSHSQLGKVQMDMHIENAAIRQEINALKELIIKKEANIQVASTSTAGQEDSVACSEKIEEYRTKVNELVKKHPPVEESAITKYLSLLSDIVVELRTEPQKQVDQLICSLRSNISLCHCMIPTILEKSAKIPFLCL